MKCVTINKTTGELHVLSHGEELNPRCFSPKDFRHDSDLLKPTAGKFSFFPLFFLLKLDFRINHDLYLLL